MKFHKILDNVNPVIVINGEINRMMPMDEFCERLVLGERQDRFESRGCDDEEE